MATDEHSRARKAFFFFETGNFARFQLPTLHLILFFFFVYLLDLANCCVMTRLDVEKKHTHKWVLHEKKTHKKNTENGQNRTADLERILPLYALPLSYAFHFSCRTQQLNNTAYFTYGRVLDSSLHARARALEYPFTRVHVQ